MVGDEADNRAEPGKSTSTMEPARVAAMHECIKHARALLESAKATQAIGHQNIAYHLAILALEEIGRRELIGLQSVAVDHATPQPWMQKHTQDHVKKLFWCFFGANFFSEPFTKESFTSMQEFSTHLHERRLAGLYVDYDSDGLTIPSTAVSPDDVEQIIGLARARLGIAESENLRESIPKQERDRQTWFLAACDDPDIRKAVFSKSSLDKLTELKDAGKWAEWLKAEFDRAEQSSLEMLQQEIHRSRQLPDQKTKDKWRIRIRIYSQSHSIRPKLLTNWNKTVNWIKLLPVSGQKNQLLVEFILGDNIPIEALWFFGWGLARHFVTALNMGTMGFWWWHLPEQIDSYYESMEDIERNQEIRLRRSPSLAIDWGKNRVLTEMDLGHVSACFAAMPGPSQQDKHPPFGYYISGVTLLAANDVHWQCEPMIFGNFFESIRKFMLQGGLWKEGEPLSPVILKFLDELFPNFSDRARFEEIFRAFECGSPQDARVTLREVSFVKLFCDSFFLAKYVKPLIEAARRPDPSKDSGLP